MIATDLISVGDRLRRIVRAEARPPTGVRVTWDDGQSATVDLAPVMYTYKVYAPLRDDPVLFASLRVGGDGGQIEWRNGEIDVAGTTIERLSEEVMAPGEFSAFLKRNGYTDEGAAAELGISKRLVTYYASASEVPRYIALACWALDQKRQVA